MRFVRRLLPLALFAGLSAPLVAETPRLISLAPHLTELAYAAGVGDRLVGAVEWSDYPEAARNLPRIGDAFRFDLEAVLRLHADAALAWSDGTPDAAIDALQRLGLEVHRIPTRSLGEIADALDRIGVIGGRPEHGESAAREFRARIERFAGASPVEDRPQITLFYQVSERPLFTLGGRHVINEIFGLCGARNAFGTVPSAALTVDFESVLARAPLAIVAGGIEGETGPLDDWRLDGSTPAARCGHLLVVDPDLLVRPTPRVLDGADRLCRWLDREVRNDSRPDCRPDGAGSSP